MSSEQPIAVFDSGVGGISVLKELVQLLPNENYIYFGDSIHAPYGTRSLEDVRSLTLENIQSLIDEGCKCGVIACNTATSAAIHLLRERHPQIPMIGVEPALKPAVLAHPKGNILVMATPMTIREQKFAKLMTHFKNMAQIIPLPCPGLMEYVERGVLTGQEIENYLLRLLAPYNHISIDAVVLGCTHYPFVKETLQLLLPNAQLFDGGKGTAKELRHQLQLHHLISPKSSKGTIEFRNSLADGHMLEISKQLFQV